ncbi:MAG: serine hydrolase [Bacteroidota bacterium]
MKLKLLIFLGIIILGACQTNLSDNEEYLIDSEPFAQEIAYQSTSTKVWNTLGIEDSIIILQNDEQQIPFQNLLDQSFYLLHFGDKIFSSFDHYFRKYANAISFSNPSLNNLASFGDLLAEKNPTFIVLVNETYRNDFSFINLALSVNKLAEDYKVVLINFSPEENLVAFSKDITLFQLSSRNMATEALAAQALFGGTAVAGALEDSISLDFPAGSGDYVAQSRLKYAAPEEVGISTQRLNKIDQIAENSIDLGVFPGCQVLVAKEGKVIYNKAFGHHTYSEKQAVKTEDLYDLASITKAAGTTLAAMKLYEELQLDLNAPIRTYIPGRSSLYYTRIRHLLLHTSGLQANVPIAKYIWWAKENENTCDTLFCSDFNPPFTVKVAEDLYFNENEVEQIWEDAFKVRPRRKRYYRYSDLNFVLLQRIIEEQTNQRLDEYLNESFYEPMGLRRFLFNPLDKYEAHHIAPTVVDTSWRHQVLRGDVHDECAALLGGVAGNAGLFSNAEDLAAVFQMLLNGGSYGGVQYFAPSTVDKFTSKYPRSRRALGFDIPNFRGKYPAYAKSTSVATFGHTGFSGTCVWADPEEDLLFVFLTNRIHPNKYNKKITRYNIRSKMHQAVYNALGTARRNS